jgi:hypothetical protein
LDRMLYLKKIPPVRIPAEGPSLQRGLEPPNGLCAARQVPPGRRYFLQRGPREVRFTRPFLCASPLLIQNRGQAVDRRALRASSAKGIAPISPQPQRAKGRTPC